MKFLFALVALFTLQVSNGSNISNILDNFQLMAENIRVQIGLDNIDANKVNTASNENTNKLILELQSFGDKMNAEFKAHQDYIKDKVKGMREHLHTVQTNLKNAASRGRKLQRDFNKAYKATIKQLRKFLKKGDAKDLEAIVTKYSESLNNVLKIGQDEQKKVEEATKPRIELY